ncbi:hypothetical protein LWI28_001514 [Acer negundo]|uniref:Serine carboxypeptidase n=1 Tax=Acer negundo TaxID=4023 RepID=A0AAD5JHW4_ACENE|nr:hypothetical protein LWI28_001514 [Acer negundo]
MMIVIVITLRCTYVGPQDGLMEADKIDALPGQPKGVDFNQFAGYVNVDPKTGKSLFYYFVESPQNFSTKPLVLWLNGGPGYSSIGNGAMEESGPFRVNSDGKTLFRNEYAWNNGTGFSYSNNSTDYSNNGDKRTAEDSYTFLVNWLERFPQYKTHDFFVSGKSYAGHFVPQLAYTILSKNKNTNQTVINLKGIAVKDFDPCSDKYVNSYLNLAEVQTALHAKSTNWSACRSLTWTDSPTTVLPTIQQLIASGISVWLYSGDMDARIPVTSSRYSINVLNLSVETAWRPWYSSGGRICRGIQGNDIHHSKRIRAYGSY